MARETSATSYSRDPGGSGPTTGRHPRSELEKTRDQVIEGFRRLYEQHEQKNRLIDSGLRQIRPYLDKLTTDWEFDKDTFTLARELEKPIRAVLEAELVGHEAEDAVAIIVRRVVKRTLYPVTSAAVPISQRSAYEEGFGPWD